MAKDKPPAPPESEAAATANFRVFVDCPTPLAKNPCEVVAGDATGAWVKFCQVNGITGTDHPKTIEAI